MLNFSLATGLVEECWKMLKSLSVKGLLEAIKTKGLEWYTRFRIWFFGLDLDQYKNIVEVALPVMCEAEDSYTKFLEVTEHPKGEQALEDCLEISAPSSFYDREHPDMPMDGDDETYRGFLGSPDDAGAFNKDKLKALRKEKRRIRPGKLNEARKLLAAHGRAKHEMPNATLLDRQAVLFTLHRECARLNICVRDADILCQYAAWEVMTPVQQQMDSVALTFNEATEKRRIWVEAVSKFGGFTAHKFGPLN